VLLGDGGLSGTTIRFTSVEPEIIDAASSVLPHGFVLRPVSSTKQGIDYRVVHEQGRKNTGRGHRTNPILNALREMGLMGCRSHEKFIPQIYLRASVKDRIDLLRGLMDTDGYLGCSN